MRTERAFVLSAVAHAVVLTLFGWEISLFRPSDPLKIDTLPVMVDLDLVEVGPTTNLPDEENIGKGEEFPAPEEPPPPPPEKAKPNDAKLEPEPEPKKKEKKPEPKKKKVYKMSSLLASVDKMKKSEDKGRKNEEKAEKTDSPGKPEEKKGIDGGVPGHLGETISISERDAIAAKLRTCWNLDPGVRGIENMAAEIRVSLNPDGSVKTAQIADTRRASGDAAFRAVAESARRAVFVCDGLGDGSPFRILAKLYAGSYALWKDVIVNFNPLDGGVS